MQGSKARRPKSAGAVYVAVLGVAMIVSLIALASIHVARVETNVLTGAEQTASAELLAQSAAEWALVRLNANATWRSSYASGAENPSSGWVTVGAGRVKFAVVDADGNLGDNPADMVTIRGIGLHGKAAQVASVDALPAVDSLNCLEVVLHSGGNVTTSNTISGGHVVSSNGNILVGGQLDGDVWATGSISGSLISGVKNANMSPARQMPDATAVWAYYLANGTRVDIDDVPTVATFKTIEQRVISSGSSPISGGETNSQGIYIIDCENKSSVRIRDCRVNATIVVINPTAAVEIDDRISWTPPSTNFPALMVNGNLDLKWDGGSALYETSLIPKIWVINFNPSNSPYEGTSDADALDSYPGVIEGLVYCSGNLTISMTCEIEGVVVAGGTTAISAATNLVYDQSAAVAPPPGFATGSTLRIIPRTWRRSVR